MAFENSTQIQNLLNKIVAKYRPGGAFDVNALGSLERKKKLSLASTFQNQVSRGLANTSVPMANAGKFEENIGVPVRTAIEETREGQLSQAMLGQQEYLAREQAGREQEMTDSRGQRLLQERLNTPTVIGKVDSSTFASSGGSSSGGSSSGGSSSGGSGSGSPSTYPSLVDAQKQGSEPVSLPQSLLEKSGVYEAHKELEFWQNYLQKLMATGANPSGMSIEAVKGNLQRAQQSIDRYSTGG